MKTHELKTWPNYFAAIAAGVKDFELRKNDRDYQIGDALILRCFDPIQQVYLPGRPLVAKIKYVFQDMGFGLHKDFAILGLTDIREYEKEKRR